jgi:hypothetical protein
MGKAKEHGFASGRRLSGWDWGWARSGSRLAQKLDRKDRVDFNVIWSPSRLIVRPIKEADPSDFYRSPGSVIPIARLVCVRKTLVDRLACRNQGRPRLTWSDTSSKSARPAKDFESCETVSIAESAQCCLVRCPAQLVSRDQTSLYSKIEIFFPVHGKGHYVGAQSETNVKWPCSRSLSEFRHDPASL